MISIQRIMKIHPKIKEIKEGKSEHTQYNNSLEITLGTCSQTIFSGVNVVNENIYYTLYSYRIFHSTLGHKKKSNEI